METLHPVAIAVFAEVGGRPAEQPAREQAVAAALTATLTAATDDSAGPWRIGFLRPSDQLPFLGHITRVVTLAELTAAEPDTNRDSRPPGAGYLSLAPTRKGYFLSKAPAPRRRAVAVALGAFPGGDGTDAALCAQMALRHTLAGGAPGQVGYVVGTDPIVLASQAGRKVGPKVVVHNICEVGVALGNGYLWATPTGLGVPSGILPQPPAG